MFSKKSLVAILLIVSFIAMGATFAAAGERYSNKRHGISVEVPDGWRVEEPKEGSIIVFLYSPKDGEVDNFAENINISVETLPSEMTAEKYFSLISPSLKKMLPEFNLIKDGTANLQAGKAKWLIAEFKMKGMVIRSLTFIVVKGKTAHIVTCTALNNTFEKYIEQFETAVKSLRFEAAQADIPGFVRYTDKAKGYSIGYPKDWERLKGSKTAFAVAEKIHPNTGSYSESMNVVMIEVPRVITQDEFYKFFVEGTKRRVDEFKVLQKESVVMGGENAVRVTYSGKGRGVNFKVYAYMLIKGKKLYLVTCGAKEADFDKYKALFEKIANSFRYEEDSTPAGRVVHKDHGFSMAVPPKWTGAVSPSGVTIKSAPEGEKDDFYENIVVNSELAPGFDTDRYYKLSVENLSKAVQKFNVVDLKTLTSGYGTVKRLVCTYQVRDTKVKSVVYLFVANGRGFAVVATALQNSFDRFEAAFDEIFNSFRIEAKKPVLDSREKVF